MAASTEAERVLGPVVRSLGFDLEGIEFQRAGRRTLVRVVIDRDGGVDLDAVAEASAAVSQALDSPAFADALPGPFVLEVTSPGVDRPLVAERHWRRAVGRLVEVTLTDGSTVTGRLSSADGAMARIVPASPGGASPVEIDISGVRRAVVQVEFGSVE